MSKLQRYSFIGMEPLRYSPNKKGSWAKADDAEAEIERLEVQLKRYESFEALEEALPKGFDILDDAKLWTRKY